MRRSKEKMNPEIFSIEMETLIQQGKLEKGKLKKWYNWVSIWVTIGVTITAALCVIVIVISMLSGEISSPTSETSPPIEQIPSERGMKNIERNHWFARHTIQNEKRKEKIKSSGRFLNNLEKFQKELQMVTYRYEQIENTDLYLNVKDCELNKCGNLTSASTSEEEILKIVQNYKKFRNKRKYIKKQILKSLSNFQIDVQFYQEHFQYFIKFEESLQFKDLNATTRSDFLNKLQNELGNLRVSPEVVELFKGRKGRRKEGKSVNQKEPVSPVDLRISEWRVLTYSKKYLKNYEKSIGKVIQLLRKVEKHSKKRKQEKEKDFLTTNNL